MSESPQSKSDLTSQKNIFLMGPPNCGKTTLFNWLTGFKNKIVNYPGSTVFVSKGALLKKYGYPVEVIDSPGTYSLKAQSNDEKAAVKTLSEDKDSQIVVLVLDASKLEVQLPLFFKLQKEAYPVLIALTMLDILPKSCRPQAEILSQRIQAPVVSIQGLTGVGVLELVEQIKNFKVKPLTENQMKKNSAFFNQEFEDRTTERDSYKKNNRYRNDGNNWDEGSDKISKIDKAGGIKNSKENDKEKNNSHKVNQKNTSHRMNTSIQEDNSSNQDLLQYCKKAVEDSLIKDSSKNSQEPLINTELKKTKSVKADQAIIKQKDQEPFKKNSQKLQQERERIFLSEKRDRFFLHPKFGFVLFSFIMFSLFSSIFWLAAPFMDAIDLFFSKMIDSSSQTLAFAPQIADFISNGLLAGLGAVLIFVPQIFILFAGISLLEDSGYLARAVSLMDGPFSKIGLSGRSFVPFLSGYACAIPSLLLAKNLKSEREKQMVFFSVPFMSCSARLPVYALLLSFLFYKDSAWKAGLSLTVIYISSFLIGMVCVAFLNRFLKQEKSESFILDLPVYRRPSPLKVINRAMRQSQHYILKAGPPIFFLSLFIWVLTNYPSNPALSEAERASQSWGAQLGLILEPVFQFMGMDWRVGFALIAAFAAREVFVSALLLIFTITKGSEETLMNSLLETMKTASHSDGSLIFTTAGVLGLIIFFMFSLQCLSTSAVVYKESGSLKFAVTQFISLNVLAYFIAVICYQSLKFIL